MEGNRSINKLCRRIVVTPVALALLLSAAASSFAAQWESDEWLSSPVDDQTFQTYLHFFTYDTDVPFDLKVHDKQERDGIRKENISFQSTPGVRVYANSFRPLATDWAERPAVVMLHGGTSQGKEILSQIALQVVRGGLNVLAIDMLYFGERKTDLLQKFTEDEKQSQLYNQPATYLDWVAQTIKDVGRSFDLLTEEYGMPPDRIGLFGLSRGAQVGTIAGAVEDRFAAVVLAYGGHFDAKETGHLAPACPANYIGRISPTPLFLLNGTRDSDYDRGKSVLPMHELAEEPVEVRWVDTGHQSPGREALQEMIAWLRENIH